MYTFLDLEKPYVAPDSMTVTLHSMKFLIIIKVLCTIIYPIHCKQDKGKSYYRRGLSKLYIPILLKEHFKQDSLAHYSRESINRTYTFKSISGTLMKSYNINII
jgi:hypothetical protein